MEITANLYKYQVKLQIVALSLQITVNSETPVSGFTMKDLYFLRLLGFILTRSLSTLKLPGCGFAFFFCPLFGSRMEIWISLYDLP